MGREVGTLLTLAVGMALGAYISNLYQKAHKK